MSEDSTESTEAILEPLGETVDSDEVSSWLESEVTTRSAGRELGRQIGRTVGSIIGREVGSVVAVDVRDRKGIRIIISDVWHRVTELLASALRNADVDSMVSTLVDRVRILVAEQGTSELVELTGDRGDDDPADADETETTPAPDEEEGSVDDSATELAATDLQELREETYRELLEVMSYRDLQSIAKEVGVKANLSQDELIEQVSQQFTERTEE